MTEETRMTVQTPEQMRALADRAVQSDDGYTYSVPARELVEYNAALRAAADQLEAVQRLREAYAAFTAPGESSDV